MVDEMSNLLQIIKFMFAYYCFIIKFKIPGLLARG